MMRKLVTWAAIAAISLGISTAGAFGASDQQFIFRYKSGKVTTDTTQPEFPDTKDIYANYIGGVGETFSEQLPLKPEWQDDHWQVTKGTLPEGIRFDSVLRRFVGTATKEVSNVSVELTGTDMGTGEEVASALAKFSFYQLPDTQVSINAYAHKGKYFSLGFTLPAGITIHGDLKLISEPPPGVYYNARYLQGTPTESQSYPVLAIGYDFSGNAVVAFKGKILVEDRPTFPHIPDSLQEISYSQQVWRGVALWDRFPVAKINRSVNEDPGKVRYFVELAEDNQLPGTLAVTGTVFDRVINGIVSQPYEQATIRYRALDTDGVSGYSNWFKIGTLGPEGVCAPVIGTNIPLGGVVETPFPGYTIPSGYDAAKKVYTIVNGTLPDGLTLDSSTGRISGTPTKDGVFPDIRVTIDFPDVSDAKSVECGPYQFSIYKGALSLDASAYTGALRVGSAQSVELTAGGVLLQPWSISMDDGAVLPDGYAFDAQTHKLSGPNINKSGNYYASFTLTNGDGNTRKRGVAFSVHDPLKIDPVPETSQIKQYDTTDNLFSVSYDPATIIGSPKLEVIGDMPEGIRLDDIKVGGGTRLPQDRYGPFLVRLSDDTGSSTDSNQFWIEVTKRDELVRKNTIAPRFMVNLPSAGQKPFSVEQPPLAKDYLPLQYTLNGPPLPENIVFDRVSGEFAGSPKDLATIEGYTVTVDEIGPDNLHEVSDTFAIVVDEPGPIPDVTLETLQGNVGGPAITSMSPVGKLAAIRNLLVGFEQAVVFTGASDLPTGMSFDPASGTISGAPGAEFDNFVDISYKDGAGRVGTIRLPVKIHPYPEISATQEVFEIPRLANAASYDVKVVPTNSGFYKGATWELIQGSSLPTNMTLTSNENSVRVAGQTGDAVDTTKQIKIRATSKANGLTADANFTIKITKREGFKLNVPEERLLFLMDKKITKVQQREYISTGGIVSGSFVGPVKFSLRDAPQWMSIDGSGQIQGTPSSLGEWTVTLVARDGEGVEATDTLTVKVSLAGYVTIAPGGESQKVRMGEYTETHPQTLDNIVLPWKSYNGSSTKPGDMSFDSSTGVFSGVVTSPALYQWYLQVADADSRGFYENGPAFELNVIDRVRLEGPTTVESGKQYDPKSPIFIQFTNASNIMNKVNYVITGDIPGTLYYKYYADDVSGGAVTYIHYREGGGADVIQPFPDETTAQTEARLALDHLIFDTLDLTLKGIPSKEGRVELFITAVDDYPDKKGYLKAGPHIGKVDYNKATAGPVVLDIAPADPLLVSTNKLTETLHQHTSRPTIVSRVENSAYGAGVRWVEVTSNLPDGVVGAKGSQALTYTGYSKVKGTFNGTKWKAIDFGERNVETQPVDFTVTDRQPLELVANRANPRHMIVFDTNADMTIQANNRPYGNSIGKSNWQVTGQENLPPGVTVKIENDFVKFEGTSDLLGTYQGIKVVATDSLGQSASMNLVFKVIPDPEKIELNVSAVVSKVGFPVRMEPPFALAQLSTANTYGALRFYSYDAATAGGLSINQDTGHFEKTYTSPQSFDFDLFVTDETNRLTSETVMITVTPNLRVLVPVQVLTTQGSAKQQTIATDFYLGLVTYEKGRGNWPDGVGVDPTTGTIFGTPTAASATYGGLTIVGKDSFGTFIDEQHSNEFAIVVEPTEAAPVISDISGGKLLLGNATQAVSFKPTVKDSLKGLPWNYGGTVYTFSHPAPQGMTFNRSTGEISGTPTEAFILRNFTVTVESERGDADTTAPFTLAAAPANPIAPKAGLKTDYVARRLSPFTSEPPAFDNVLGTFKYTVTDTYSIGLTTDQNTGIVRSTSIPQAGNNQSIYPVKIVVTDEFGRTGSFDYNIEVLPQLSVTASAQVLNLDVDIVDLGNVTASGGVGTLTYTATGLPTGLTMNSSTGKISGRVNANANDPSVPKSGDILNIGVTVTDARDNKTATTSFTLTAKSAKKHRYWRWVQGGRGDALTTLGIQMFDADGNNLNQLLFSGNAVASYQGFTQNRGNAVWDNDDSTYAYSNNGWVQVDFLNNPQEIKTFIQRTTIWYGVMPLYYSDNGTTWTAAPFESNVAAPPAYTITIK